MTRKPLCKLDRVLLFLRQNQAGLNALEAVQLGEYALRSTISTLREEGWQIEGAWEHVAVRDGVRSRVLRYRLTGYRNPAEVAEEIATLLGEGRA